MTAPRLHVIPAARSPLALVVRRGPSRQVASLLWNRETGALSLGQWLMGRIYEYRSDLSPDGRHMIVFAGNGRRWWTALSRAPWLTARGFWPQGHTWHGGGAFTARGQVFLNGAYPAKTLPDGLRPAPASAFPHSTDGFHMGGLYAAMLALRGWEDLGGARYDTRLGKPVGAGWHLEISVQIGAPKRALVSLKYALRGPDGTVHPKPDWTWAEAWAGGLHMAEGGALWSVPVDARGLGSPTLLHDLNPLQFSARQAPYPALPA
ncbi:MAG: hypothetical protein AAF914_05310 [Pseudomonadota bacterium]